MGGAHEWDDVVPVQWGARPAWTPEQRLCARVLEYAVAEAVGRGVLAGGRVRERAAAQRRLQRVAWAWLRAPERTGPFSFLAICRVLALSPDRIRRYVRAAEGRRATEAA